MLNIVVPMAGLGSRFAAVGYTDPKPLIPVRGTPMIRLVVENLRPHRPHRFIFIAQREHVSAYNLEEKLKSWAPGCKVVQLDGVTEGAACTVLTAETLIGDHEPLMIANSDQYVDIDIEDYLERQDAGLDGLIMTMTANDPKWSFVGMNGDRVTKVVEKVAISDEATVGIYNFARGGDFVRAAKDMIAADLRVNGEFYVAPVYNQMIGDGAAIGIYNVGTISAGMYGLGTPDDLEIFVSTPASDRAAALARAT